MSPELRVIGGSLKGRKIRSFHAGYRPTAAIVKKSLFDMLSNDISGSKFLDLFAGCGAVGIEAISRGASWVTFVENDHSRCAVLNKNLKELGIGPENCEFFCTDYDRSLDVLRAKGHKFDFVYIDPPYGEISSRKIMGEIFTAEILESDGWLIFESGAYEVKSILESMPDGFYPVKEKIHGSSAIIIFRYNNVIRNSGSEQV